MNTNRYPKRFEILQNDGKTLEIRVGELVEGIKEYFVKFSINGKIQIRWEVRHD